MGELIQFPVKFEPWLDKRQLADHLGMSVSWVEKQMQKGMPFERMGNRPRFKVSVVEQWLERSIKYAV